MAASQSAYQGHGNGDTGGGRDEVLHHESGELHGVAQGGLGRVGLPVGVGDEGDGRGEGHLRGDRAVAQGEGQPLLDALQQVEEEHTHEAERQHGTGVGRPALFLAGVHTDDAVHPALHLGVPVASQGGGDVIAQRLVRQTQHDGHGSGRHEKTDPVHQNFSGWMRACSRKRTATTPRTAAMAFMTSMGLMTGISPPSRRDRTGRTARWLQVRRRRQARGTPFGRPAAPGAPAWYPSRCNSSTRPGVVLAHGIHTGDCDPSDLLRSACGAISHRGSGSGVSGVDSHSAHGSSTSLSIIETEPPRPCPAGRLHGGERSAVHLCGSAGRPQ